MSFRHTLRYTFALAGFLAAAMPAIIPGDASAFCGFYVAKADTKLFNEASKVVIVRDEDRTVLTMSNDFEGDVKEFAMVIPVPTVLEEGQIHVTENKIIDHLDAYTAPRLVEYFDDNPCNRRLMMLESAMAPSAMMDMAGNGGAARAKQLGVTIEAEYTVGEYDILILSAKESDGLATWLKENDYKIPGGAESVLDSYIKQDTKFFVAKVNLEEKAKLGTTYLRPIQVAYESPKFMLPIRLGTVNAKGDQELFVFALSPKGRVETANYRTVKIPSNMNIPTYVKGEFNDFYKAMFETAVEKEDKKAVFLEYAWDMNWCDPCAADPLSRDELKELGVFWLDEPKERPTPMPSPGIRRPGNGIAPPPIPPSPAQNVYVTRLHLRYNAETFPEDLRFQQTANRENYQGRYVLQHPWTGDEQCEAATEYRRTLPQRFEKEAQTLASLTGWNIADIRRKMADSGQDGVVIEPKEPKNDRQKWWQKLWDN